jgi:hypothetical protein
MEFDEAGLSGQLGGGRALVRLPTCARGGNTRRTVIAGTGTYAAPFPRPCPPSLQAERPIRDRSQQIRRIGMRINVCKRQNRKQDRRCQPTLPCPTIYVLNAIRPVRRPAGGGWWTSVARQIRWYTAPQPSMRFPALHAGLESGSGRFATDEVRPATALIVTVVDYATARNLSAVARSSFAPAPRPIRCATEAAPSSLPCTPGRSLSR